MAPENLNTHCGGLVKSDFGDRVVEGGKVGQGAASEAASEASYSRVRYWDE